MALLACAAGVILALGNGVWLATRLPEPPDGPALGKLAYANLASRRRVAGLIVMTLVAQTATWTTPGLWVLWLAYGSSVAALVWVDACTTWLPARLHWLVVGQFTAAAVIACLTSSSPWQSSGRLIAGAVAALAFWLVWWRVSRGSIGFGDVRLAPLTGAMAATLGWDGWFYGLLAASALGVVWGLTIGRRHPAPGTERGFAYAPALWAGPYAALALSMIR